MAWVRAFAVLLLMGFGLATAAAQAPQKRVALIIANAAYEGQPVLSNPTTDATLVKPALERAGFAVTVVTNANRTQQREALVSFASQTRGAQAAVIYFAGHGLQEGGVNWLLPVDFQAADLNLDADNFGLDLLTTAHRDMIQAMAGAQVRILVLDACRNNPFAALLPVRGGGMRAASAGAAGLAEIEDRRAVIVLSAEAGRLANDGDPRQGSPFARAFADGIDDEGVELSLALRRISSTVAASTATSRNPQRPKINGIENLGAQEIFLRGAPPSTAVTAPDSAIGEEAVAFDLCARGQELPCWQAFLQRFPSSQRSDTARMIISSLTNPRPAAETDRRTRMALDRLAAEDWSSSLPDGVARRFVATYGQASLQRLAQAGDRRASALLAISQIELEWFATVPGGAQDRELFEPTCSQVRAPPAALAAVTSAAQAGVGFAEYYMGFLAMADCNMGSQSQRAATATRYFRSAGSKGFLSAQLFLLMTEATGRGNPSVADFRAIMQETLRLARQGEPWSETAVGAVAFLPANAVQASKLGLGLTPEDGRHFLQSAANKGFEPALFVLAENLLSKEPLTAADKAEGIRLHQLAARKGFQFSREVLEDLGERW